MGVIKRVLYRGDILGRPRHRNLFLDMEENIHIHIHIHYRDLRIELSRGEFEEIAAIFQRQSRELLAIMEERGYRDGKLPNANQEDVRVWTESRLHRDLAYHPRRFSLEECGDGYHFHYRNYKLLLDPQELRELARLFRTLDLDAPYAAGYDQVVALLEANEVDFTLDAGNRPGELLAIAVARYHLPKVREIFGYIGFAADGAETATERHYRGPQLAVTVRTDGRRSALDYRRLRGCNEVERLADFLARHGSAIDPDLLNRIKCQVLELYYTLAAGERQTVEGDPELWLYSPAAGQAIFPYSPRPCGGRDEADALYRAWAALLARLELGFVKPTKERFPAAAQAELGQRVAEYLRREVAAWPAVERVWLMGSAARGEMGRYRAPFVHGRLAKLGSDVDILVEIDPAREADVPPPWRLINQSASNHCAVYHLAQLPLAGGPGEWPARHPRLDFIHHLVDAYLFFPSRGHGAEKEAFLKRFAAQLVYDRGRDGTIPLGEGEGRVAARVAERFALGAVEAEPLQVSTENTLYKLFAGDKGYVLKLFQVAGNYHRERIAEHTAYEARLIEALRARGVPTAAVVTPADADCGGGEVTVEGHPALLFERLAGTPLKRPEYPLERVGAALAKLHRVQLERPLELAAAFPFAQLCAIWLPAFDDYAALPGLDAEIAAAFARLAPLAARYRDEAVRTELEGRVERLHCHGDVTPKNVMVDGGGNTLLFDFNNAFYGPRLVDLIDGAFEFSLAEKYIHLADFARFDALIGHYTAHAPLTADETATLAQWIEWIGVIKFTKEVRVLLQRNGSDDLRRRRALAIAGHLLK